MSDLSHHAADKGLYKKSYRKRLWHKKPGEVLKDEALLQEIARVVKAKYGLRSPATLKAFEKLCEKRGFSIIPRKKIRERPKFKKPNILIH
jgi:DUF1009 family protein